jgi:hypothetical protein
MSHHRQSATEETSRNTIFSSWAESSNASCESGSESSSGSANEDCDGPANGSLHETQHHHRRFGFSNSQQGSEGTQSTIHADSYQYYQSVNDSTIPADQERQLLLLM